MNVFHRYNFTIVQVPTQLTGLKKRRNKTKILSSFVAAHDRRPEGSVEVEGWACRLFTSMEKIKVVCKRRWLNLQIVSQSSTGQLNNASECCCHPEKDSQSSVWVSWTACSCWWWTQGNGAYGAKQAVWEFLWTQDCRVIMNTDVLPAVFL